MELFLLVRKQNGVDSLEVLITSKIYIPHDLTVSFLDQAIKQAQKKSTKLMMKIREVAEI